MVLLWLLTWFPTGFQTFSFDDLLEHVGLLDM